jgi:hypothetical protein
VKLTPLRRSCKRHSDQRYIRDCIVLYFSAGVEKKCARCDGCVCALMVDWPFVRISGMRRSTNQNATIGAMDVHSTPFLSTVPSYTVYTYVRGTYRLRMTRADQQRRRRSQKGTQLKHPTNNHVDDDQCCGPPLYRGSVCQAANTLFSHFCFRNGFWVSSNEQQCKAR